MDLQFFVDAADVEVDGVDGNKQFKRGGLIVMALDKRLDGIGVNRAAVEFIERRAGI